MQRCQLVAALPCSAVSARAGQRRSAQIVIDRQPVGGEPMMPPGMPGARPVKTGTGRIAGRVCRPKPARRCAARRCASAAPEIGSKTALTDAEGRYEFKDLPAGPLHAQRVEVRIRQRAVRADASLRVGSPDRAGRKQVLDKADISMPRGSVISGRIVDEFGEPVADAMVSAMRQTWVERAPPAGAGRPHRADQRSRPVPHVRAAAGRVLRQRDAPQRGVDDVRHRWARRRARPDGLHSDVRLCADLLPRHRATRPKRRRSPWRSARRRRRPTSR